MPDPQRDCLDPVRGPDVARRRYQVQDHHSWHDRLGHCIRMKISKCLRGSRLPDSFMHTKYNIGSNTDALIQPRGVPWRNEALSPVCRFVADKASGCHGIPRDERAPVRRWLFLFLLCFAFRLQFFLFLNPFILVSTGQTERLVTCKCVCVSTNVMCIWYAQIQMWICQQ